MKKFFIIFITMLGVIPLVLTVSWSQSIFLKDGSIIEGKIITENDVNLTVKLNNKNIKLKRQNIIRTVYDNEYDGIYNAFCFLYQVFHITYHYTIKAPLYPPFFQYFADLYCYIFL